MRRVSQNNPLTALISLEQRIREAENIDELYFLIVNETHNLTPYSQAILFRHDGFLLSVSGVSEFEYGAPFIQWVKEKISPEISNFDYPVNVTGKLFFPENAEIWTEWFPEFGLIIPLKSALKGHIGNLLLLRDYAWNSDEQEILSVLMGAYGHAMGFFVKEKRRRVFFHKKNFIRLSIIFVILGLLAVKVPLTVLAPAEIVAVNPSVIRAPTDGVVRKVLVSPNQIVDKGDYLFEMDAVSQRNELAIAQKVFSSLKAQYSQLTRSALSNSSSKKYLAETMGRMREQRAKIEYLQELISRMNMTAPVRGAVIIDDPVSWAGKPVNLGEKVLSLADQNDVEIEAWLAISDAIELPKGSLMKVYLNSDPLFPVEGALRTFSYQAQERHGETFSHRIRGVILSNGAPPRLGLRGTARIEGRRVSLLYWIFRRPLSVLRQFFGV